LLGYLEDSHASDQRAGIVDEDFDGSKLLFNGFDQRFAVGPAT